MKKLILVSAFLLFTPTAIAYDLPDTGQTGNYTAISGEDSDYTINPRFFFFGEIIKNIFIDKYCDFEIFLCSK